MTSTTTKVLYAVVSESYFGKDSPTVRESLGKVFDKVADSKTGCLARPIMGLWCPSKDNLKIEGIDGIAACNRCAYRDINWRVDDFDSIEVQLIFCPIGG